MSPIAIDPEIMHGAPCFTGTRVPVTILFEFLEAGDSLDEFLRQFPSVSRGNAVEVLEMARKKVVAGAA